MASAAQRVAVPAVSSRATEVAPETIHDIETPALVLEMGAADYNIRTMADRFKSGRATLRPHIKNHKAPELAKLQIAAGASGVTCATLREAEAMFRGGIKDILIANEVAGAPKIAHLVRLAAEGADMKVAVDTAEGARQLSEAAAAAGVGIGVLVDLNVGLERCGVNPGPEAVSLAKLINGLPGLKFLGLMAFEGHAGLSEDRAEQEAACREALGKAVATKRLIEAAGIDCPVLSASNTRTFEIALTFPEVTEIQAGMYLFLDPTYAKNKGHFKQAIFVLTRVISVQPDGRAVADAGSKAVTGIRGMPLVHGRDDIKVAKLSAEHAWIERQTPGAKLGLGDILWLIPAYGDLVAVLHRHIYAVRGEIVEHVWEITG